MCEEFSQCEVFHFALCIFCNHAAMSLVNNVPLVTLCNIVAMSMSSRKLAAL